MAKIVTLFDIFLTILERNANDETRNFVLPHLLYEKRNNTAAVTMVFTFFHQNTCGVNKKVHICVKSI